MSFSKISAFSYPSLGNLPLPIGGFNIVGRAQTWPTNLIKDAPSLKWVNNSLGQYPTCTNSSTVNHQLPVDISYKYLSKISY
jgi:hypothetical protein